MSECVCIDLLLLLKMNTGNWEAKSRKQTKYKTKANECFSVCVFFSQRLLEIACIAWGGCFSSSSSYSICNCGWLDRRWWRWVVVVCLMICFLLLLMLLLLVCCCLLVCFCVCVCCGWLLLTFLLLFFVVAVVYKYIINV